MSVFKPLYYEGAKHIYKMLFNSNYRKYSFLESKLLNKKRYTHCQVTINDCHLEIPDALSFLSAYKEIFVQRIYDFKSENDSPNILDLGANVGLSVLFFKKIYPKSKITAFEADPKIFRYLESNLRTNGFDDVILFNKAAWHQNTTLIFDEDGADGGKIANEQDSNGVIVEAIDINQYLCDNKVDYLKMDIEGAEDYVFPAIEESLSEVKHIFVEYHSKINKKQTISEIINILVEKGFRVHILSVFYSPTPFIKCNVNSGFDLQLNIFGWKL